MGRDKPSASDPTDRRRPSFFLFGKFRAVLGRRDLTDRVPRKVQELLSFLLLFRQRPHHREALADALWGPTPQSRKQLRQGLWQLRTRLPGCVSVLVVRNEWIQVDDAGFWLDVAELEEAFGTVHGTPGERVDDETAGILRRATERYGGDLLEGCYQDWCIFERERLKAMYLASLEKLLGYYERVRRPDEGLLCGERILRQDRAHERTHWRLMRLHYLAGDRTGAMRQYESCATALRDELDVDPAERTTHLYQQIRSDRVLDLTDEPTTGARTNRVLEPLRELRRTLSEAGELVDRSIRNLQDA